MSHLYLDIGTVSGTPNVEIAVYTDASGTGADPRSCTRLFTTGTSALSSSDNNSRKEIAVSGGNYTLQRGVYLIAVMSSATSNPTVLKASAIVSKTSSGNYSSWEHAVNQGSFGLPSTLSSTLSDFQKSAAASMGIKILTS